MAYFQKRDEPQDRKLQSSLNSPEDYGAPRKIEKESHVIRNLIIAVSLLAILSILVWQGNRFYVMRELRNILPNEISRQIDFPVYLPLAKEYRVDRSSLSFDSSTDVLFYSATEGKSIIVSEQKKLDNFSLDKFTNAYGLDNPAAVNLTHGRGLKGTVNGQNLLIIEASSTILTIISTDSTDLVEFANNLRVLEP